MKISTVQFCPKLGQKQENIKKIYTYIDSIDSDIIVFPELSTSGYFYTDKQELAELAETSDGPMATALQAKASDQNKIIIVGFPEKDGDDIYNSSVILFPDPALKAVYRKTHLFYKEKFVFTPGDSGFFVTEDSARDIKIGMMICYDWRFPEATRSLALAGADLIVCPSNLVTNVWHKVMPARALENKVYLAVANRIGTESKGEEELFFNGESAIYSYNGAVLCKAAVEDEKVISADIDPKRTRDKSFNPVNDIFKDRRPELYRTK